MLPTGDEIGWRRCFGCRAASWIAPAKRNDDGAFGSHFPLPFGRGEGQDKGLNCCAEGGVCRLRRHNGPLPRPSPPPRGEGESLRTTKYLFAVLSPILGIHRYKAVSRFTCPRSPRR